MPNTTTSPPLDTTANRPALPPRPELGDFRVSPRVLLVVAMATVVGALGALSAWALTQLIALTTNLAYFGRASFALVSLTHTPLGFERVLLPVAGGLIIGLMARYGTEKIRGHGIPEAIEAILLGGSRIQPKVAILKPLSSAISIGSGGPFGAEGPIIMTGGALGSLFAQLFHLTSNERKTLLVAGAAAGMTGIFGTPVAAVLLAVELLLFEWKPRSFLPVVTAVVVAAACRGFFFPSPPLFPFHHAAAVSLAHVATWAGIGIAAGLGSAVLTALVYGCEDVFQRLPVHWMWWPALGGIVVGIGGLIEPAALGVGYDNLQAMLADQFTLSALVTLLIVKTVIWSVALGSGTSGGVLAPLLIVGGALGALLGHWLAPGEAPMYALLGMAAMMGGTMRSPLTATVFGLELTANLDALLPLMTACAAAHGLTVLLLKRSVLTERIARRGHHLTREYSIDPFELMRVKDVMVTAVDTLPASMTTAAAVEFFTSEGHRHKSYPVLNESARVIGMVSRTDILRWTRDTDDSAHSTLGALVGGDALFTTDPDEIIGHLVDRMTQADVGRVPVVAPATGQLVGLVSRKDLLRVRADLLAQEHHRSAPLRQAASSTLLR